MDIFTFCEKYGKIDFGNVFSLRITKNLNEQGGKMLKIIKRAGSNKSEHGGKNLENS